MNQQVNNKSAEEVLSKYLEPICTCGGFPECICDMTKNSGYLIYQEKALKAMQDYSNQQNADIIKDKQLLFEEYKQVEKELQLKIESYENALRRIIYELPKFPNNPTGLLVQKIAFEVLQTQSK